MAYTFRIEREDEEAHVWVTGNVVACDSVELFQQVVHLIDQGYHVNLHLQEAEFVGLGLVRALRTAALRAQDAGVSLRLTPSRALYRVADLVGAERWSPLPELAFEDDSVAV